MEVGTGGAGHGTLGVLAVKHVLAAAAAPFILVACSSAGPVVGTVSAVVTGSYTGNPAVGAAVGIAVNSGVNAVTRGVERHWRHDEQEAIASVAGRLTLGQIEPWSVHHLAGTGDASGRVLVVRDLPNALTPCREAVFSVETDHVLAGVYSVVVCQNEGDWVWASAEPATARWTSLQ